MDEFDNLIPCPKCGAPLETVQIERITIVEFHKAEDEDDVDEFQDNGQGSIKVRCYKCGKEIGGYTVNQSWGIIPKSMDF
jgi:ssDNA-binding Zn-finger/Zn-ribbon topoisomerase 1